MEEQSPKGDLNKHDYRKNAIFFGMAVLGAAATVATEKVSDVDFGPYTPMVVAVIAAVADLIRRWQKGPKV